MKEERQHKRSGTSSPHSGMLGEPQTGFRTTVDAKLANCQATAWPPMISEGNVEPIRMGGGGREHGQEFLRENKRSGTPSTVNLEDPKQVSGPRETQNSCFVR